MRGRRRTPPKGNPGGYRRDDRRYPAPRERRRRSVTPDRVRRGGSPPPFKRGRYGRDPDNFHQPRGYDHGFYGRHSPPARDRSGPRAYKDFCRTLHDDVTPEEAQREYQLYLAEYWGSEVRADFETKKSDEKVKRKFDPRGMKKAMDDRNEDAQKSATGFLNDLKAGLLDPKSEDFNQGLGLLAKPKASPTKGKRKEGGWDESDSNKEAEEEQGNKKTEEPLAAFASAAVWIPERVQTDLAQSKQLIEKLDKEKGISEHDFPGDIPANPPAKPKDAENAGAAESNGQPEDSVTAARSGVGQLDLQLTYLWRVHALDYYGGKELYEPEAFGSRGKEARTLRGPKPEEGEKVAEAEEKKGLKQVEKRIDQVWKRRLVAADPYETALQKEKVEKLLEEWVEDQVKKIDENKWGCKLSTKLFVGRDYVLKHVKLKHSEKVEEQRSKIYDELYFENYKRHREEEQKKLQDEMAKLHAAQQVAPAGGLPVGAASGSFPQLRPIGGIAPRPLGAMGVPSMMPQPGQMLVLAPGEESPSQKITDVYGLTLRPPPGARIGFEAGGGAGAGPMGPFIQVPIADGQGFPGRGMLPARGRFSLPRGGGRGPPPFLGARGDFPRGGGRGYFDLDNPSNNRAVLDYGDL